MTDHLNKTLRLWCAPCFVIFFLLALETPVYSDQAVDTLVRECKKGNIEQVEAMLAKGVNVNATDRQGRTALITSANSKRLDIMKLLINNGADVNGTDRRGQTALIVSCGSRDLDAVLFLLENGADLKKKTKWQETALMKASSGGLLEIVRLLLAHGADFRTLDRDRNPAFFHAVRSHRTEVAEYLFNLDPDFHIKGGHVDKAFRSICGFYSQPVELLKFLLEKGADIDAGGGLGWSCLINASINGREKTVNFLLKNGANVDLQDSAGNTALISAAKNGHAEVVKTLLRYKPNLEIKNTKGRTALAIAKTPEITKLLKMAGAEKPLEVGPKTFDIIHALPYEKRLVKGLELAFKQVSLLLLDKKIPKISIKTTVTQQDPENYKITYTIESGEHPKVYPVLITNRGRDIRKNLDVLQKALRNYYCSLPGRKAAIANIQHLREIRKRISDLLFRFDYVQMFKAFQIIAREVIEGRAGPLLLYSASEVYSWLAFFKNASPNRKISDILAAHAVCNFLLAGLSDKNESERPYYEGLLMLSLGYPLSAKDTFDDKLQMARMLKAFITYDFETLNTFERDPKVRKCLLAYLKARGYRNSNQTNLAWEQYERLISDYPDFLPGKEYAAKNAKLGISRGIIPFYLVELMEKHLQIMNNYLETGWLEYDRELQNQVRVDVSKDKRLPKWLKIHGNILKKTSTIKGHRVLLNGNILRQFLEEDMGNALYIWFDIQYRRLGIEAKARDILEMTQASYPDGTVSRVMNIKMRNRHGEQQAALHRMQLDSADRFVVETVLGIRKRSKQDDIFYVKNYREKENPNAEGLYRLAKTYDKLFYRPVALNCLKKAIEINPYDYRLYEALVDYEEAEPLFQKGKAHIAHLYGYLTSLAAWKTKYGKRKEAVSLYKEAIAISPKQQLAYHKLGEIHHEAGENEKAIEAWKGYLVHDDKSLYAVEIKNELGELWMEMEENQKAYDILMEGSKSAQGNALLNFAKISEKTGKTLQAEKYFKKAAERYPQTVCPGYLAAYYLRQKNKDQALQIIKEYKRFGPFYMYLYGIADHFLELGTPEKAMDIVRIVEGGNARYVFFCQNMLGNIYEAKGNSAAAAREFEKIFSKDIIYLKKYWNCTIDAGLMTPGELITELTKRINIKERSLVQFAAYLISSGFPQEAGELLAQLPLRRCKSSPASRRASLLHFAMAWRVGKGDSAQKNKIKQRLESSMNDQFLKSGVLYLLGEIDEQTILDSANTREKRGNAYYYIAAVRFSDGKKVEALKHLLMTLEILEERDAEFHYAYEFARNLAGKN